MVDSHYYDYVVEGMRMAVTGGTCRIGAIPGIEVCGKTGTAQNPHGKDHSAFMGFAPMGSLMMEMYLNRKIAPERKYLEERMLQSNTIIYSGVKKH